MVKVLVDIEEEANKVLNIVKAQYGLKDKSQAINKMAELYKEIILESDIRPEYVKKIRKIQKEPIFRIGRLGDFKKKYGFSVPMYNSKMIQNCDFHCS